MKSIRMDFDKVRNAIKESSETSRIYVGADSQRFPARYENGKHQVMVAYVVAVIIHIDGNKGAKLFKEVYFEPDYSGSLRQRLMTEVGHVARVASEVIEVIGDRPFEIHLDVNPSPEHQSNAVVKEAVGWIYGQFGIKPKIKPEAFASSTIADRYAVRGARIYAGKKGKTIQKIRQG